MPKFKDQVQIQFNDKSIKKGFLKKLSKKF
jgi:hypothetical protein